MFPARAGMKGSSQGLFVGLLRQAKPGALPDKILQRAVLMVFEPV